MLVLRKFQPQEEVTLYHYCSPESFQAIIESGKMRFTDVNMLNDSSEYHWGYSVFEEAATRLITGSGLKEHAPRLPREFFDTVDDVISSGQLIAHPFVSCFSLDGNSLDQWRKYADDGRGYAIGFSAAQLGTLPISLLQVSYDRDEQVLEMMVALCELHSVTPDPRAPLSGESFQYAALIAAYMGAFKHPSFATEREVRGLHVVSLEAVGESRRFVDSGGQGGDGVSVAGEKVRFATRAGALTAYVDLPYDRPANRSTISEVVMGPKNPTGVGNLFLYLGSESSPEIRVRPSGLPYR